MISDQLAGCVKAVSLLLHRYDIKGCELGRWTDPDKGGKRVITVLKDNNFKGQSVALGGCLLPYTYSTHLCSRTNDALEQCTLNGKPCVVDLGQEKSWFANQVKVDAAFLQGLNVLDYSLLLAHQPLHTDELEGKHSLANLVLRTTK